MFGLSVYCLFFLLVTEKLAAVLDLLGSELVDPQGGASVTHSAYQSVCRQTAGNLYFERHPKYTEINRKWGNVTSFLLLGQLECFLLYFFTRLSSLDVPVFRHELRERSFLPAPLSLRSTAPSWFGVENWWPVVCPHRELPCLQTLSTSTSPCNKTLRTPPALWVRLVLPSRCDKSWTKRGWS